MGLNHAAFECLQCLLPAPSEMVFTPLKALIVLSWVILFSIQVFIRKEALTGSNDKRWDFSVF